LVTIDDLTGVVGPRVLCRAFTENSQQALASLDRLGRLAADVLLPGHGEPWRGAPSDAVRGARQAGVA
jgi:glyoxylase-like metal-dependent hydrolase (beta-lactamase superfamily II)